MENLFPSKIPKFDSVGFAWDHTFTFLMKVIATPSWLSKSSSLFKYSLTEYTNFRVNRISSPSVLPGCWSASNLARLIECTYVTRTSSGTLGASWLLWSVTCWHGRRPPWIIHDSVASRVFPLCPRLLLWLRLSSPISTTFLWRVASRWWSRDPHHLPHCHLHLSRTQSSTTPHLAAFPVPLLRSSPTPLWRIWPQLGRMERSQRWWSWHSRGQSGSKKEGRRVWKIRAPGCTTNTFVYAVPCPGTLLCNSVSLARTNATAISNALQTIIHSKPLRTCSKSSRLCHLIHLNVILGALRWRQWRI